MTVLINHQCPNCVVIDFTVSDLPWTSWMMSLLLTRQAGHDSGELCLVTFSTGESHRCLHAGGTCTCRDRGGYCVPWGRTYMMERLSSFYLRNGMRLSENPCWTCHHNHGLSYYFGSAGFVFVYINPIGEIKFFIGDDEVHQGSSIPSTLKHKRGETKMFSKD